MNRRDYEQEFERLAWADPIVRTALYFHERDRANVDLVLAMKVMVVELAKRKAELEEELNEKRIANHPTVLFPACPEESKTETSSE